MPKKTFFNLPEDRQKEIVEKAIDLYISVPYEEITLRRLTDALEMPMGTFYRYFSDKDELYLYTCNLLDMQFVDDNFGGDANMIRNPAYDVPAEDKTPERHRRLFESFHRAPEEVQRKFYFDIFTDRSIPQNKKELMHLKYQGLLREEVDLDLAAYIYATSMYNLNMYLNRMNITDEDLRWRIRKNLFYSFFKYGIMKSEDNTDQIEEGTDRKI